MAIWLPDFQLKWKRFFSFSYVFLQLLVAQLSCVHLKLLREENNCQQKDSCMHLNDTTEIGYCSLVCLNGQFANDCHKQINVNHFTNRLKSFSILSMDDSLILSFDLFLPVSFFLLSFSFRHDPMFPMCLYTVVSGGNQHRKNEKKGDNKNDSNDDSIKNLRKHHADDEPNRSLFLSISSVQVSHIRIRL